MLSLKMLSNLSPAFISLRSFRLGGSNFGLHLQRISMTAVNQFEHFIDKEFEKAQSNLDTDTLDNPRSLLQKLERNQKWRIETMKRARTARLFKQSSDPRTLTWDTMEQIRYLKQENSDEWSVQKLAYTFGVSEALIIKVLKSKFVPSEKRVKRMDDEAKINTGLLPERTATMTRETSNNKALPSGFSKARPTDLTPVDKRPIAENRQVNPYSRRHQSHHEPQTAPLQGQKSSGKSTKQRNVPKIHQTQKCTGNERPSKGMKHPAPNGSTANIETFHDTGRSSVQHQNATSAKSVLSKGYARVAKPGGVKNINNDRILESDIDETEFQEELYIDMENLDSYDDGTPPPQLIRKGNEFYDENGEFLYRV